MKPCIQRRAVSTSPSNRPLRLLSCYVASKLVADRQFCGWQTVRKPDPVYSPPGLRVPSRSASTLIGNLESCEVVQINIPVVFEIEATAAGAEPAAGA